MGLFEPVTCLDGRISSHPHEAKAGGPEGLGPVSPGSVWDPRPVCTDECALRPPWEALRQGSRMSKPPLSHMSFVLQGIPGEAGTPGLVGPRVSVLLAVPGGLHRAVPLSVPPGTACLGPGAPLFPHLPTLPLA